MPASPGALAAEVAAAMPARPAPAALGGGPCGTVAALGGGPSGTGVAHLPGRRRVPGVRVGGRTPLGPVPVAAIAIALALALDLAIDVTAGPVPAVPGVVPEAPAGPVTGMPPTVAGPSAPVPLA